MAVFQTHLPKAIGPVRSARSYYVAWASELKALYAHAGGSPQALATLRAKGRGQYVYNADVFRWEGRYFHRIHTRVRAAQRLHERRDAAQARATGSGPRTRPFKWPWDFAPDAPLDARPYGGTIRPSTRRTRSPTGTTARSNTYLRSVTREGKQIDASDDERIAPKNVIVMIISFGPLGDKKHRLEADLVGSGRAWISTNGRTVKGTWKKTSITKPTRFYGPDGQARSR